MRGRLPVHCAREAAMRHDNETAGGRACVRSAVLNGTGGSACSGRTPASHASPRLPRLARALTPVVDVGAVATRYDAIGTCGLRERLTFFKFRQRLYVLRLCYPMPPVFRKYFPTLCPLYYRCTALVSNVSQRLSESRRQTVCRFDRLPYSTAHAKTERPAMRSANCTFPFFAFPRIPVAMINSYKLHHGNKV
eukprot:IDg7354t1